MIVPTSCPTIVPPRDYDADTVIASVLSLSDAVDEIFEFRLIGGEPFMNRDWLNITQRLLEKTKKQKIHIFTNGTIAPDDAALKQLRNNRIIVNVADYGRLSPKIDLLVKKLQEQGVCFGRYGHDADWLDCSRINYYNRSIEENRKIFHDCCAKDMLTVMGGNFFLCPYSANLTALQGMPDAPEDRVSLLDDASAAERREALIRLLRQTPYLSACDYCLGRNFSAPSVPAALQADRPLPYTRYQ